MARAKARKCSMDPAWCDGFCSGWKWKTFSPYASGTTSRYLVIECDQPSVEQKRGQDIIPLAIHLRQREQASARLRLPSRSIGQTVVEELQQRLLSLSCPCSISVSTPPEFRLQGHQPPLRLQRAHHQVVRRRSKIYQDLPSDLLRQAKERRLSYSLALLAR